MKETQLLKVFLKVVLDMIGQKSDMVMSWFRLYERLVLILSFQELFILCCKKLEKSMDKRRHASVADGPDRKYFH